MVTANKKGKGLAPGGKGAGGGRGGELTKEERERREKIRQQTINGKFVRERKFYKSRYASLKGDFMKSLRTTRSVDMKKLVRFLMENYEKEIFKQQDFISTYFKDLMKCNFQYKKLTSSHSELLEEMSQIFRSGVKNVEDQFLHFFIILKKDFNESVKEIRQVKDRKEAELRQIIRELDRRDESERKDMEVDHLSDKEVIVKRYSKIFEVMKINMDKVVTSMKKRNENLLKTESTKVGNLFSQYRLIKKDDIFLKSKISDQLKNLKNSKERYNEWKAKYLNNLKNFKKRNELIKNEIKQMKVQYQKLKKQMTKFQKMEKKKLLRLVKFTRSSKTVLLKNAEIVSRILQRQTMLDPLETEKEKLFVLKKVGDKKNEFKFGKREADEEDELERRRRREMEEDEEVEREDKKKKKKEEEERMENEYKGILGRMKRYHKKVNKVDLINRGLKSERELLVSKNLELRNKLKIYINGISVNPQILRQKNSLLIQQKINLNKRLQLSRIKNIML